MESVLMHITAQWWHLKSLSSCVYT